MPHKIWQNIVVVFAVVVVSFHFISSHFILFIYVHMWADSPPTTTIDNVVYVNLYLFYLYIALCCVWYFHKFVEIVAALFDNENICLRRKRIKRQNSWRLYGIHILITYCRPQSLVLNPSQAHCFTALQPQTESDHKFQLALDQRAILLNFWHINWCVNICINQ